MSKSILDILENKDNEIVSMDSQVAENQHVAPIFEGEKEENDFFSLPEQVTEKPAKEQVKEEEEEEETNVIQAAEADMFISVTSLFTSRIASAIGQQPPAKYAITKEEKSEFKPILIAYSAATGFKPNIHVEFWLAVIAIYGVKFADAIQDRRDKVVTRKRIKSNNINVESMGDNLRKKTRTRFEVDVENYYTFTDYNEYLKKESRTEKPTSEILNIIQICKAKGMSNGEINKAILTALGEKK